jgi:hypothetical protein
MRLLFLTGWLLVLVIGAAWHFGPGQEGLQLDEANRHLVEAQKCAAAEQWAEADAAYDEALRLLPPGHQNEARVVRLEQAKARMLCHKLPTAHDDLKGLVDELKEDAAADPKVLAEARSALASAQYYMTWLLRLEGEPREVWEPEIEGARQSYRMLAEQAEQRGDADNARKSREDLEASVRLARMDLSDLQGLPLPSQ